MPDRPHRYAKSKNKKNADKFNQFQLKGTN